MAMARGDDDPAQRVLDGALCVLMLRKLLREAEEQAQRAADGAAAGANTERVAELESELRAREAVFDAHLKLAAGQAPRVRIAPSGSGSEPSAYLTLGRPGTAPEWTRVHVDDEFEGLRVDDIVAGEGALRLTDLASGKRFSLTTNDRGAARSGLLTRNGQERAPSGVGGRVPEEWAARRAEELEREAFEFAERRRVEEQEAVARQRAEAGAPQIRLRGFFDDAETGVVTAFLEFEWPAQGRRAKVALQEGETFQGLHLDNILGRQKGVLVTDLATGQESTVVPR